ncbi:MAG TPA: carboxypeptidase-like regulatory domain-containing protein [Bacteroidota bacterium]|nr:carboxypeptidase-like regulatory domain-containing protein [Bacteroidota bacterium]
MKYSPLLILLTLSSHLFSQTKQSFSINGYVQDKESSEKLIGCYVVDSVSHRGVLTNAFGYFSLSVKEGTDVILFRYLGYARQSLSLNVDRDTTVIVRLSSQPITVGEVNISGSYPDTKLAKPQMGEMTLKNEDIKSLPAFLGEADVMRAIQIMPGIQSANERSTGISVRGGGIDQNLFLLDDAPIFQISHLMGLFSVFNNDAVKDVDIYKGDIPANYGGRISSVVDIRLRDGNMQDYKVSGGIGLICSDLSVEGPIVTDRVSFIVSGKYSYLTWMLRNLSQDIDLTFYDLNCKLNAVLGNNDRIYISSYDGHDNSKVGLNSTYQNNTFSLRWNHVYTPALFSNVSLIYSNYGYESYFSSSNGNSSYNYSWTSGIKQFTLKAEFNYYLDNNNTIDFGASSSYSDFVPGKLEGAQNLLNYVTASDSFTNRVVTEQGVLAQALYVSNEEKLSDEISVKYGIRAGLDQDLGGHWVYTLDNYQVADSIFLPKNKTYANFLSVEPRIGLNYRIADRSAIKASYTYSTQHDQLLAKSNGGGPLDIWFPSDNTIKPQTASQYNLGYVHYLFESMLEASLEGYYKDLRNIIDYKDGATFLQNSALTGVDKTSYNFEEQLRTGKGYAYGAEFTIRSSFPDFNGFVSYAYARSFRIIPGINSGQRYLSPFDRPHTLDLFLNCPVSRRVSLSANFRYQSGQVITIPVYLMEMFGKTLMGYSERNGYRLPSYQRLDVSATVQSEHLLGIRFPHEWNFSILNLLGHANIQYVKFQPSTSQPDVIDAKGVAMFTFLPSVSLRFHL